MIGVIAKLENGERLSSSDWKRLIKHEFNVSGSTASDAVHVLMKCRKVERFKRAFNEYARRL